MQDEYLKSLADYSDHIMSISRRQVYSLRRHTAKINTLEVIASQVKKDKPIAVLIDFNTRKKLE